MDLIKEKTAVGRATPEDALLRYKQALKNLIEEGDLKLTLFHNKNGELVEKLEALILTASGNTDLLARTTSLRDKVVGESVQYRNCFKRLMAEHETLLAGVWGTGPASTSVAALPLRIRITPIMIHSDCTKRELLKFVGDGRTWTSKTISEIERKEEGIVYAVSLIQGGRNFWTDIQTSRIFPMRRSST